MSEMVPVVLTALILAFVQVNLRSNYPEYATVLAILFTVIILLRVLGPMRDMIQVFYQLGQGTGVAGRYFDVLLRTMAVAYITAFGSQICKDAGEKSLAIAVEFAGKLIVMIIALPIILGVVEALTNLLP
ncbi:MAG: stage III sporulation protein AD [Firmicutes bacterium]|nr:stage III sporulation protein AD [Bacillota bacterium]